ncbi:MAG: hypothetical protein ACI9ND_001831 [Yoonia sp.]|jgi:hypothetical protein
MLRDGPQGCFRGRSKNAAVRRYRVWEFTLAEKTTLCRLGPLVGISAVRRSGRAHFWPAKRF